MSKKLIAVASATALALSALVGVAPASASATAVLATFVASTGANDGSTADKAATLDVPSLNVLATSTTAGTIDIGATAGDTITITTTGAVKGIRSLTGLGTASPNWNVADLGKSSFTYAAAGTDADDIFVYTTSTTAGSVEVKVTSSTYSLSKTFYVKGVEGLGWKLTASAPTTVAKGAKGVITATVTDIFGNAVEDTAADDHATGKISLQVERFPSANATVPASLVWNDTAKNYQGEFTALTSGAFTLNVTMEADDGTSDFEAIQDVSGIADADFGSVVLNVNAAGVATQIASLTAQIAALQVIVDRKVTKKRYNTLARKWNRAFPSQKVWVKP
jgi:hypothetical protein